MIDEYGNEQKQEEMDLQVIGNLASQDRDDDWAL